MAENGDAVVLLNMGGASNLEEVPKFMRNMFLDKRILSISFKPLRWFIGSLITLRRAGLSQANYRLIGSRSPLLAHTQKLAQKLAKQLGMSVVIAMRYLPPDTVSAVKEIKKIGAKRVVLIPLYPQFSTTTTLSSLECFDQELERQSLNVRTIKIERFYDHQTYNSCVIEQINKAIKGKKPSEFALIFSAHALPMSVINRGDTYEAECKNHIKILIRYLALENIEFESYSLAYQSKIGFMKWLTPSLEQTFIDIARRGIKKILIVPISFTIDNYETDYELSIDYLNRAKKMGFSETIVAACPNDSDLFVDTLSQITAAALTKDNI